jgi:hypothetical protein
LLQVLDATLRNTRRFAQHLKDSKVIRHVKAVIPKADEAKLQDIMESAPPVRGRRITPGLRKRNKSAQTWVIYFKETGTTKIFKAKHPSIQVSYQVLPSDTPLALMDRFHNEMASYYERFPYTVPTGSLLARVWQGMILSRINSRYPEIGDVYVDNMSYRVQIIFVDSDTGEVKQARTGCEATVDATKHIKAPSLGHVYLRSTGDKEGGKLTLEHVIPGTEPSYKRAPTALKNSSQKAQRAATDALRWIAMQLHGTVCSTARMDALINYHRELVGMQRRLKKGIYGNETTLYTHEVRRDQSETHVAFSETLLKDVGVPITKLHVHVYSLNASRVTPVSETAIQLYCAGEDPRIMLIESAKIGDQVNMDISEGVPPSSHCDCDNTLASEELHACEGCNEPTICASRYLDSVGRYVCKRCHVRDQTLLKDANPHHVNLNKLMVNTSLQRSFRSESRQKGLDHASMPAKAILQSALLDPRLTVPHDKPTSFTDSYTGKDYDNLGEEKPALGKNPSRRRVVPHQITVDACFPRGDPDQKLFKHSVGNLEITTTVCNTGKGRYLPGTVHEIGAYLRDPSDENRANLIKTVHRHTLVMLKERYTPKTSSYSKLAAEMLCGKPASGEEGPWEQHALKYTGHEIPPLSTGRNFWDNDTWNRLQTCAQSIAQFFGVSLFQLVDNTLWVGDALTNPPDLNRNGVALFCKERLDRMRLDCNKKWATKDSIETIYMEIVFQYCASHTQGEGELSNWKGKYGDRLGLPLIMYWNSPLRLSVAHREHGFGMFTGWPSTSPTNVQERINNDSTNNMLIESWYVNSCKLDMDEQLYGEMDDILRSVKVPKDRYNPTLPPPSGSASMTTEDQDSEDVDKIDYFEGERFNDDADDAANDDIAAASAAEGTSGAQPPETPAASVSGVVEDTSMSEQPSYRMGPDDIRSSLDAITDSLLEDDDTKQKFRNDKTLFVLLGQAHGFVLESQFDEAHDKLAALQALLAEEL